MDSPASLRLPAVLAFAAMALLALAGAQANPWTVDRDASRIEMSFEAFGSAYRGRFTDFSGDIDFDPADPARTRAAIVVQSASLAMSPAAVQRRAIGPTFLDAARHPVIRFDLLSLEPSGGDRYTARATVTMRGRTRPVTFPVDLRVTGDQAHLTGALVLNSADFGIGTAAPWNRLVGRLVTVRVSLQARRG